ncbi:zinc-dependent metalloprotease [Isoptericola sp. b408]|uniref:zinc-dependent metalloprotease n=1 Tax=Isoptericola sp. b408 TaxID=3064653 RepID=UPI002712620F|nr:zinc-dependent metalloprotease [Isoptericola sp. b408]MDO8152220.1 zinc-dependent metalloprotease [Isoptericola sp. b408]
MTSTSTLVDWQTAAQIARRVGRPGPVASRAELDDLVEGLRTAAQDAVPHVLRVTRMRPADADVERERDSSGRFTRRVRVEHADLGDVRVVDRATWARANTTSMAALTDPVLAGLDLAARPVESSTARLAAAAEVGGLLALLSSKVLGQFDPYGPGRPTLLLVAPNVLAAERAMQLDPQDFRLWVCLHEQTHALQFAAAPWLAGHLADRMGALLRDVTASSVALSHAPLRDKVALVGRTLLDAVRGDLTTPVDQVLGPDQKEQLAEITAVMALLEGHADVMMDAVGRRVVPSVRTIRSRFEKRRDGEGAPRVDVVLRRVLGMDAKIAQYRDGAAFVRAVEEKVGRDGLNAVWAEPGNLPSAREISDPRAWVRRVHS